MNHRAGDDQCRCGDCWPFNPGSDAEHRWVKGERATRSDDQPHGVLPPAPVRIGGLLPGDLEILAARADALAGLYREFPSLLGSPAIEWEGSQGGNGSEASSDVD